MQIVAEKILDRPEHRLEIPDVLRRILLSIFALLATGLLVLGWYAYNKGFTRKWRELVTAEFRKRDVELSMRRLTLEPFRGIVAKEVKVYEKRGRRRTVAVVDEVLLVINYTNLFRGKTFIDALDLRDANLDVPVDPAQRNSPKIEIRHLSGRLFLPPQQLYLSRLEAEIYGLRLRASGRVINPQAFRFWKGDEEKEGEPMEWARRIIDEIKALNFEGNAPQIDLRFSGDLAEPEKVFIETTVWAEKLRRGNYLLENLYIDVGFRDGVVRLRQLAATDSAGNIRGSGSYDLDSRDAALELRSTLDIQGLVRSVVRLPEIEEAVFYAPPAINLSARATFDQKPHFQMVGHLDQAKFAFKSVIFDGLKADVSWDGDRWSAIDVHLAHRTGEITGDVLSLPGDFRTRMKSSINPKILAPLLSGRTAEWFRQFDFFESAKVDLEASGSEPTLAALTLRGHLDLGRCSYRGVPARSFHADVRYKDRQLAFTPFRVERAEGAGAGSMTFDFARDEVRFEKIRTNVNPSEVIEWIDPKLRPHLTPYRFKNSAPNLLIDGLVHTKGGRSTHLTIDVEAPWGMDYTFLKRDLHFPQIAGRLEFKDHRLQISKLSAGLFGGNLRGGADISLEKTHPGHRANLQLDNVDFASLTKLYFNYDDSRGRLHADYQFTGRGDDARTMAGHGEVTVTNGDVFAIPFLGPISGVLDSIVPGMGKDVARKASASFAIDHGVIATDDLLVEGRGFSMIGGGKLMYLDDQMDFDVRINAQGLPGVLLFPVSKLFEYASDGKLSKPAWRPKRLPRL
jgi:hypothetical protein